MGTYLIALAVTVSSCATVAAASPGRWGQGKDGVGFAAELLFATDAEVLLRKAEDRELTVLPRKELSDAEERSVALFLQQESTKGSPAEWRTWSNKSGSKQVVGKLVHAEPEHIVLLKKADGLLYVVPFDALCDQDQQYVGNRLKAPVPAEGPMPPAPQEPVPVKPAEKPAPRPEEKEPVPPSTPERKSPSTVEQGRTAKTVPTTTAQNQQVPDSDAVTVEVDKLAWLQTPKVPVEEVSKALNSLWVLPVGEAAGQVEEYRKAIEGASDEGRKAALLLVAVGLERTEQKRAARIAYEEVKAKTGGTPYARSAALRLRLLDLETERLDTEYEKIAGEAAAEEQGWFLIESDWQWSTQRQAYLQALAKRRASYLSVRFLDYLRTRSPWPPSYAYLFILAVLTIGVKIVALPINFRAAQFVVRLKELAPQIQRIQHSNPGDPAQAMAELQRLYQRYDVKPTAGCLVGLLDLVFVIWSLVTLSNYAPQMSLDGASFLWVTDVTKYSTSIILCWLVLNAVLACLTGTHTYTGQPVLLLGCGTLIGGLVILAIAWYWQWPAYVFLFWILLSAVGTVLTRILVLFTPR